MKDAFSSLGVVLGAGARITCHTYPNSGPILKISFEGMSLSLSLRHGCAMDADEIRLVRRLAAAVGEFAAEAERMHLEHVSQNAATEVGSERAA